MICIQLNVCFFFFLNKSCLFTIVTFRELCEIEWGRAGKEDFHLIFCIPSSVSLISPPHWGELFYYIESNSVLKRKFSYIANYSRVRAQLPKATLEPSHL